MISQAVGTLSEAAINAILETFAQLYIRGEFRSRFLHEARQKPGQLDARVCHGIEQLFEDRFKMKPRELPKSGVYLILYNTGFKVEAWPADDAALKLAYGGLIISHGGKWFWSRSEPMKGSPEIEYHAS